MARNDGKSWSDDDLALLRQIYPDDDNIVNVANMRHLWLLPEPPAFMWRERS